MNKPTEKQIEAAARKLCVLDGYDPDEKASHFIGGLLWREYTDSAADLLTAALAVEAGTVGVKPLEWVMMYDGSTYHAQSILGRWARWDGHYLPPDGYGGIPCDDPISAAQADYEARIRSALTTSPASSAVEEAVAPLGYASAYGLEKLASKAHHYCLSLTKKPENEFQCPIYAAPTPAGEWREALQKIADMRWAEDADLDDICTIADRALASPAPHQEGRK
jgi:hypothetical protein